LFDKINRAQSLLSPCCGLLIALVVLNIVARWCNTPEYFTKMV